MPSNRLLDLVDKTKDSLSLDEASFIEGFEAGLEIALDRTAL